MTSASPGYRALHESAAWLDLSDRGQIRATGEDRVRLFHSLLSNDVQGLRPGQGNYHFLLNAQGHILADANLHLLPDSILLDVEPEMTDRAMEHLDRYILADDVQLENVTTQMAAIGIEGPKAEEVAGVEVPAECGAHVETEGMIVARTSGTGQPGLRFFLDAARKGSLIAGLESRGATPAAAEDACVVRVENGIPRYGSDFGENTLPQETQQLRALHFNKGCYLGQEIVERIRTRGQVHKLLVRLAIEGREPPQQGSAVVAGDQEIGKLSSPVYSPQEGRCLGFATLRREFTAAGTAVTVAGRPSQVLTLRRD